MSAYSCTFSGNTAYDGGAIYNDGTISSATGCAFSGNSAFDGGAIYNDGTISSATDCTFSGNSAPDDIGGAIYNDGTISSATGCTFSGNSAPNDIGGAIYNDGTINSAAGCTFSGNTAYDGGAIYNDYGGTINSATGCTFSGNSAPNGSGGAIWNDGTISSATGCTFSGNSAPNGSGGAIFCQDLYGSASIAMTSCTILNSTATDGGGIYLDLENGESTAEFSCNRIVNNTATTGNAVYVTAATAITVNAKNNWWGVNDAASAAPSLFFDPGNYLVYTPWMEVGAIVAPAFPLSAQPITFIADFTENSNGQTITECHIPDGTPVAFSTPQGTIAPALGATVNGQADALLTTTANPILLKFEVGPGQEAFDASFELFVSHTGYSRLNWGCICSDSGTQHVVIGSYVNSNDNSIRGFVFDSGMGTCTEITPALDFSSSIIVNHVVYNQAGQINIALLLQSGTNYSIQLATCTFNGSKWVFNTVGSPQPVSQASHIQMITDAGNVYIAVDSYPQLTVYSLDLSTGTITNPIIQTNKSAQGDFLYWLHYNNAIYLVQGYYTANGTTIATYNVTLGSSIDPGVETTIATALSQAYRCAVGVNYLVIGGSSLDANNTNVATLIQYGVNGDGTLSQIGNAHIIDGTRVNYCERCLCSTGDNLIVGTDTNLFTFDSNNFQQLASLANPIGCKNVCWCCNTTNMYGAAIQEARANPGFTFEQVGTQITQQCTL